MSAINRDFFFSHARSTLFGGKLRQTQTDGLTAILDEWERSYAKSDDRWLAYILGTTHHETDRTMQPINEYGSDARKKRLYDVEGENPARARKMGNTEPSDGVKYAGRGFVQLTWKNNYETLGERIGVDLAKRPDRALELPVATQILIVGMIEGLFTGRKLGAYFNKTDADWKRARYIVNGQDKAELVGDYGRNYYACISYTT